MKLENILKIAIPIVVSGAIIYRIAMEYNGRQFENKYLDLQKLREGGL